jgi:hypothetical protein
MTLRNRGTPSGFAGGLSASSMAAAMGRASQKDLAALKSLLDETRHRVNNAGLSAPDRPRTGTASAANSACRSRSHSSSLPISSSPVVEALVRSATPGGLTERGGRLARTWRESASKPRLAGPSSPGEDTGTADHPVWVDAIHLHAILGEAAAVGNVLIQGRAAGLVRGQPASCGRWLPGPFRQRSTSRADRVDRCR